MCSKFSVNVLVYFFLCGCANHYQCLYEIYLISCLTLEFVIIVDRDVSELEHGKYVVDVLNYGYEWMLKLSMANILNPDLFLIIPILKVLLLN